MRGNYRRCVVRLERSMTLSQQTAKLEEDFAELKSLTSFIVATINLNFVRGKLITNPESSKEELGSLINSWTERFYKVCPPEIGEKMIIKDGEIIKDK